MSDIELELAAFMGTDLAQSLCAELNNSEPIMAVFLAGAMAATDIHSNDIESVITAIAEEVTS